MEKCGAKEEGKKGGIFLKSQGRVSQWKEKKNPTSTFGLGWMIWVHPKTAKTASSRTGALVGAGSLWPDMQ